MYGRNLFPGNAGLALRLLAPRRLLQTAFQVKRNLFNGNDMFQGSNSALIKPNAVYIDPTYVCNRSCGGCYSEKSGKVIPYGMAEEVCQSASNLKVNYIAWLGGEPLHPVARELVFDLISKFPRMSFNLCTNGDFLDRNTADKMADFSNLIPFISIDGFAEKHDGRRGNGSHQNAMKAMGLLEERGVFFGYMTTVMPGNFLEVSSEAYVADLARRGCMVGGYSLYICGSSSEATLNPSDYSVFIARLSAASKKQPIYLLSTDFGYLGRKIQKKSKRLIGISVNPQGEVRTERGTMPVGTIGRDGTLEDIVFSRKVQSIFRAKVEGTGCQDRDQRIAVLQNTEI